MRTPAVWPQWSVVFAALGLGAWVVYPAIDPFEPTPNKPGLMGIRQEIFGPKHGAKDLNVRGIELNSNITGTDIHR